MSKRNRILRDKKTLSEMIVDNIMKLHGVTRKQAWRIHKEKRLVCELEMITIFNS